MKKKLFFLFVLVLSGCKEDVEKIEFKEKLSFENYSNKESWQIDSKFFMNLNQDYFFNTGCSKNEEDYYVICQNYEYHNTQNLVEDEIYSENISLIYNELEVKCDADANTSSVLFTKVIDENNPKTNYYSIEKLNLFGQVDNDKDITIDLDNNIYWQESLDAFDYFDQYGRYSLNNISFNWDKHRLNSEAVFYKDGNVYTFVLDDLKTIKEKDKEYNVGSQTINQLVINDNYIKVVNTYTNYSFTKKSQYNKYSYDYEYSSFEFKIEDQTLPKHEINEK